MKFLAPIAGFVIAFTALHRLIDAFGVHRGVAIALGTFLASALTAAWVGAMLDEGDTE